MNNQGTWYRSTLKMGLQEIIFATAYLDYYLLIDLFAKPPDALLEGSWDLVRLYARLYRAQ